MIVLENKDGDMNSFKFLFRLYVTFEFCICMSFLKKIETFRGCYVTQVNIFFRYGFNVRG